MPHLKNRFKEAFEKVVREDAELLAVQVKRMASPYSQPHYHIGALLYPFANAAGILTAAAGVLARAITLPFTLIDSSGEATITVLAGMLGGLARMLINSLNTAISAISICTRTLATIFNLGYFAADYIPSELEQKQKAGWAMSGAYMETCNSSYDPVEKEAVDDDELIATRSFKS